MNGIMKRIILLAVTAVATASCIVDPYDYKNENTRNGNTLLEYSEDVLEKFGVSQICALNYLLTLDEFLKLSPEEQNKHEWANFRSGIEHYTETYFRIPSRGIKVDTKGLSLREPETSWMMEVIGDYSFSSHNRDYRNWVGNFSSIPGHCEFLRVTCISENKYEIIDDKGGREIMVLSLEAITSEHGGYDFSATGSGKILANKRGLSASYSIPEIYYRKYRVDEDGTGSSSVTVCYTIESLSFRVDTYYKDEQLDWCEITKAADEDMEYSSNLDISDNRFDLY